MFLNHYTSANICSFSMNYLKIYKEYVVFTSHHFQRLRNSRNTQDRSVSVSADEGSGKRKASTFTDILSRNRKASSLSEEVPNRKLSAIPEQKNRKGSTFTDLMSQNRKTSTTPVRDPANRRSVRKPSMILEEVRPTRILQICNGTHSFYCTSFLFDHHLRQKNKYIFLHFYLDSWTLQMKSGDGSEVSKPPTVQTVSEEEEINGDELTLDRLMTSLEKLHIIVGYAIVRRDLRL